MRGWAPVLALGLLGPAALAADPLAVAPGRPIEIACETEAIHLEADKFKATKGRVRLRLEAGPAEAAGGAKWSVVAVEDSHAASFATQHRTACAGGCPLVTAPGAEPQLWAPRRAAPEQLGPDEMLTIATVKPDGLVLRASTFRAKELAALERGPCTVQSGP